MNSYISDTCPPGPPIQYHSYCVFSMPVILYSGYNLRGAISANHQISHLEVIFAIIKFANHSMVLRGKINLRT